jgi:site-specific recombinase XerD
MRDHNLLGPWIRRFLLEHIVAERNLANNTQHSYRDTLKLLLPFISHDAAVPIDRLSVQDISANRVRAFLDHVENERGCSVLTRNQRLSAIHSLSRFIGMCSPEHVAWCSMVRAVPFKKAAKESIGYLDQHEVQALLRAPDRSTNLGARDHAMLLFLYNSGARADEAASLTVGNLQLGTSASVRLLGKGNKWRTCPLWPITVTTLRPFIVEHSPQERVFRGRTGAPMTRFGIYRTVTHYAVMAAERVESMQGRHISPHTMRHTTAVHLLRAGVDINTIRAWLGHVSLDTTNIYAEVDLEMKSKALASVDITGMTIAARKHASLPSVMEFLKGL